MPHSLGLHRVLVIMASLSKEYWLHSYNGLHPVWFLNISLTVGVDRSFGSLVLQDWHQTLTFHIWNILLSISIVASFEIFQGLENQDSQSVSYY